MNLVTKDAYDPYIKDLESPKSVVVAVDLGDGERFWEMIQFICIGKFLKVINFENNNAQIVWHLGGRTI